MSEEAIIQNTPEPRTRETLARDLRSLGIEPGMTIIMHSALRSLGWVCGGPVAVVQAVMDAVTPEGTIVVPTQTPNYSDPAKWQNPPVPQEWWQIIYDTMPVYDPRTTPSEYMGRIVEAFRGWPGVIRSSHPHVSFAAWGKHAQTIIANHSLEYGLGEESPLARIYELDGWILMLGTGYDTNTSLHLAEYRAPGAVETMMGTPIMENGTRIWKQYRDIEIDSDIFPEIGADYEEHEPVTCGKVGSATAKLLRQRAAVDFAVEWLTRLRAS